MIDVSKEVQKWIRKRDYIFFNNEHFIENGDLSKATAYFKNQFNQAKKKMKTNAKASQLSAIQKNLQQQGYKDAEILEIVAGLEQGTILEDTINLIGQSLDTMVQNYYNSSGSTVEEYLNSIQSSKSSYNNLLAQGPANPETLNQFFNFILQGLRLLGEVDSEIFDAFTQIGQRLSANGKSFIFKYNGEQSVKPVSQQDIQRCQTIVSYLDKAANILETSGSVSARSFSGTLTNIFSKTIGEELAKFIIESSIKQADDTIINTLLSKGLTLDKGSQFALVGDKSTSNSITSKSDIINTGGFQMKVTSAGGNTYNIDLMSNFSVKTYSKGNANIKIVDNTPFGNFYQMGNTAGYYAYNIMAHRKSGSGYSNAYELLRQTISASFLDDWLSGTGGQYTDINGIDKVQFLMINGRIYSISDIVSLICDKMMAQNAGGYKPVTMSIQGRDSAINKWVSDSQNGNRANPTLAKVRSDASKEVINNLVISAHFNSNILKTYVS